MLVISIYHLDGLPLAFWVINPHYTRSSIIPLPEDFLKTLHAPDGVIIMKNIIALLSIGLALVSFPCWAADFDKDLAAHQNGDFEAALREWTQLADCFRHKLCGTAMSKK